MKTPVLVVGAGPVGLVLAGDLGWRGVQCTLLERGDGSIFQPKIFSQTSAAGNAKERMPESSATISS